LKPGLMPPLTAEQRVVPLPAPVQPLADRGARLALPALLGGVFGRGRVADEGDRRFLRRQLGTSLLPLALFAVAAFTGWHLNTRPGAAPDAAPVAAGGALAEPGGGVAEPPGAGGGVQEPPGSGSGLREPPAAGGLQEPPGAGGLAEPPGASSGLKEPASTPGLQ
ncbi:MAG: C4-dicarboxylate ABC transporter, partial [Rubrivivax sp.]